MSHLPLGNDPPPPGRFFAVTAMGFGLSAIAGWILAKSVKPTSKRAPKQYAGIAIRLWAFVSLIGAARYITGK